MTSAGAMNHKGVAVNVLTRHLRDAINRVREDMEKVEFWADAVSSFSEPVPEYDFEEMKVWLPSEQATQVSSAKHNDGQERSVSSRRRSEH
jgi:hypothetical protein